MKKPICYFLIAAIVFCQILCLSACRDEVEKEENIVADSFEKPEIEFDTYDNLDFSDYTETGEATDSLIPDQWSSYGTGDPFVMRFNGTYYLYPSTKNSTVGIRAWKSKDLIKG